MTESKLLAVDGLMTASVLHLGSCAKTMVVYAITLLCYSLLFLCWFHMHAVASEPTCADAQIPPVPISDAPLVACCRPSAPVSARSTACTQAPGAGALLERKARERERALLGICHNPGERDRFHSLGRRPPTDSGSPDLLYLGVTRLRLEDVRLEVWVSAAEIRNL